MMVMVTTNSIQISTENRDQITKINFSVHNNPFQVPPWDHQRHKRRGKNLCLRLYSFTNMDMCLNCPGHLQFEYSGAKCLDLSLLLLLLVVQYTCFYISYSKMFRNGLFSGGDCLDLSLVGGHASARQKLQLEVPRRPLC